MDEDIKKEFEFDGRSFDNEQSNRDRLKTVFPECFLNDEFDVDKLLALCGEYIENEFERYNFQWKGKADCLKVAQQRSTGTLRPCVEESVNFHETDNLYIEGDNLEVLKLMQTAYFGKVKMIYIDPPYNTGHDFVYEDDFKDPIATYKEVTSQATKSNPENMGRFHTKWLNMMYPRLRIASNLLTEDGVIFISIDDNEVFNLKKICDEVFGEENFIGKWHWYRSATPPNLSKKIKKNLEYILCYEKNKTGEKYSGVFKTSPSNDPFIKPKNSIKQLTFCKNSITTKLKDGIYKAGTYGTVKFPNILMNDLIVSNGTNENDVIFENKFIWTQENLEKNLNKGTKIFLSNNKVLSFKKGFYDKEAPPNLINNDVGVDTTEIAGDLLDKLLGT